MDVHANKFSQQPRRTALKLKRRDVDKVLLANGINIHA